MAEKLAGQIKVIADHFNEDGTLVQLAEAQKIEKEVDKRFEEKVQWVFDPECEQADDIEEAAPMQARSDAADQIRECRKKVSALVRVGKCSHAGEKDEEHYEPGNFKVALEDALEVLFSFRL